MTKYKPQTPFEKAIGAEPIPVRNNPNGLNARKNAQEEVRTGVKKERQNWQDPYFTHAWWDVVFATAHVYCRNRKNHILFQPNRVEWQFNEVNHALLEGNGSQKLRSREESAEQMASGRNAWKIVRMPHVFEDPRFRSGTPLNSVDRWCIRTFSHMPNIKGSDKRGGPVGGSCDPANIENFLRRHRGDFMPTLLDALKLNGTLDLAIELGYIDSAQRGWRLTSKPSPLLGGSW